MIPRARRGGAALSLARAVTPPGLKRLLPRPSPRLVIIDWGQCGGPTTLERRRQLARLYLALADNNEPDSIVGVTPPTASEIRVAAELRALGVRKTGARDDGVEARMARGIFDSNPKGFIIESRAQNAKKAKELGLTGGEIGGVEALPKDLFLVLRVTQMLRGLGASAERAGARPAGTLAEVWRPLARRALRQQGSVDPAEAA
jgi:hypothetical protein